MCVWVKSTLVANMDLTQAALLTKAKTFAEALDISDFKGSPELEEFMAERDLACQQVELKLKNEFDALDSLIFDIMINGEVNVSMSANEFVDIDADVIFEMLSDGDIIYGIENRDNDPYEETLKLSPLPKVTDHEALKAFHLIETYLLQQSDDFCAIDQDRNIIRRLRKKASKHYSFQKKQVKITGFFHNEN
ncbi:4254_t:CDS:2 [Dentiscutata erythropus]|uniref:4254_t:CDS:1 n=1 Tax=Dentiscutata erythropus TaxID=1348616 RepID=A0A9N9IVW0_9GLOM|nr:4254_t:CDS:2 [Dentiscutata erythropus]